MKAGGQVGRWASGQVARYGPPALTWYPMRSSSLAAVLYNGYLELMLDGCSFALRPFSVVNTWEGKVWVRERPRGRGAGEGEAQGEGQV